MEQFAENIFKDLVIKLTGTYEGSEAKSISYLLLEEFFNIQKSSILLNNEIVLSDEQQFKLSTYIQRLKDNEPIQHIIGKTCFFNRNFKVNKDVLVPRQETEELIARIIKEHKEEGLKVLDIGTGSGVIAISLGLELSNSEIHAWDVSKNALYVAKENAIAHKQRVAFKLVDILSNIQDDNQYDIIVSNPPYVMESEKMGMKKNVLLFDPHLALFVPDEKPLVFHEAIASFAKTHLKSKGRLYMEINESLGDETAEMVEKMGFNRVKVIQDLNGKDRFIQANAPD